MNNMIRTIQAGRKTEAGVLTALHEAASACVVSEKPVNSLQAGISDAALDKPKLECA